MSKLNNLKKTHDLKGLAKLLGYKPIGLSYVLYKIPDNKRYKTFAISKKSGGERIINAPEREIKLLQSRLADFLYDCIDEIQMDNPHYLGASHAFQKERTIISNAKHHQRRKYVFNIDLEDFFGTINFGRVRGFFLKDSYFTLQESVATIIAQITCHKNALPQGSPSSPVISNLIGNILDRQLSSLARDVKCTYTRYADDLTFSTNMKSFPPEIAVPGEDSQWHVGDELRDQITQCGFSINDNKTRMSLRCSRQTVTGLVVNSKPNINQDYYRSVRAMCHSLFGTGNYYLLNANDETDKKWIKNLNPLEGMLSHIYFVKMRRDRRDTKKTENSKINKRARKVGEFKPPEAPGILYKRFLYYKHFAAPTAPLIVCEGKTDIIYLKCAINALIGKFPLLADVEEGKSKREINFLKRSGSILKTLDLAEGASGLSKLIGEYQKTLSKFKDKPMSYPVIILCDNDADGKKVFSAVKTNTNIVITPMSSDSFFHLFENLYLVKVPENTNSGQIEDLFPDDLLNTKFQGKVFELIKENNDQETFDKIIFAKKIVFPRRNDEEIFSDFEPLLQRISDCISDYQSR